jgi:hypothetical protein
VLREEFDKIRRGELGVVRSAHALVYRPRVAIGRVNTPAAVPESVDYDLWCGPAPKHPLSRTQLHYEWHWFWETGNGEMGNNGVHVIDLCRWALGQDQIAPRVLSVAGRFGFDDAAETPNTQVAFFDYQPAPLICEIRNLRVREGSDSVGEYRRRNGGIVIECEGGYLSGDASGVSVYDRFGVKAREVKPDAGSSDIELAHLNNFLDAVRSRKAGNLKAEALEGHRSTGCCHVANIGHRIGKETRPEAILEMIRARGELANAFERCREHLRQNDVDLAAKPAVLSPWLTWDAKQERFTGEHGDAANRLARREDREPFKVPEIA